MTKIEKNVQERLFALQDIKQKAFIEKLIPTVAPDRIIGIKTPQIRQFAKEFAKSPDAEDFLMILPHRYLEENNLHSFIVERMKDYDRVIAELDKFLPYVDNWATCDSMKPAVFKNHLNELAGKIGEWLNSKDTYTVRFGIEMLMNFYLDEHFSQACLEQVAALRSDEYYINMMIAWYFATALAKQYETAVVYIEQHRLDTWTNNKTIQKAVESYRITDEQKAYLKTLKIK